MIFAGACLIAELGHAQREPFTDGNWLRDFAWGLPVAAGALAVLWARHELEAASNGDCD
jgi:hypothetical protein